MGADVDGEHVGPGHGHREHPGLCVHPAAQVALGPVEGEVLLAAEVVVLGPEGVKLDGQGLGHQAPKQFVLLERPGGEVLDGHVPSLDHPGQLLGKLVDPLCELVLVLVDVAFEKVALAGKLLSQVLIFFFHSLSHFYLLVLQLLCKFILLPVETFS